jgi:hypothetical protein
MTELIPYFSGAVTLLFGIGFYLGLQKIKDGEDKESIDEK